MFRLPDPFVDKGREKGRANLIREAVDRREQQSAPRLYGNRGGGLPPVNHLLRSPLGGSPDPAHIAQISGQVHRLLVNREPDILAPVFLD